MRAALDIIIFAIVIILVFHLSNLADRLTRETELKKRGVICYLDRTVCVKGIPDLQGTVMSVYMYNDRISVDDILTIPLDRVKMAQTFNINEIRVTRRLAGQHRLMKFSLFKIIWSLTYFFWKMKTNHYLSVEYSDQQDNVCKALFLTNSRSRADNFAIKVNHQIGAALTLQSGLRFS